jgi:hypothetical protein
MFVLPPNPKIMALGDSITHGNGYDIGGGYRQYLWTALPTVQPIGSSTLNPLPMLVGKDHQEGHPGATLPVLATGLPGWIAEAGSPDAILLHGGTNDTYDFAADADAVSSIYSSMIATNPRAILFVASPIIAVRNRPDLLPMHDALVAALAARIPLLGRVIAVPMPSLMPDEMADDFHPNSAGYLRMSMAWEVALRATGAR